MPALRYFVVAFGWAWALWWTASFAGRSITEPVGFMLYMTGGLGPLVGAVWLVRRGDRAYRRAFLRRVWDPSRITVRWWFALVAVTTLPALLGAGVAGLIGSEVVVPVYGAGVIVMAVLTALAAGLVEEPGWRGAAADAWQERTGPVWAALGIGVLWSLWHLPLSFIDGTHFHSLGFGSARFWLAHLMLVQLGLLYLWLANGSGGSIFVAVLAHAGFNVTVGLVPSSTAADLVTFVVLLTATVAVLVATKGRLSLPDSGHQPQLDLPRDRAVVGP